MKIEMKDLTTHRVHELLTRSISPLPIALISTVGEGGVHNAAPFSLVVPISYKPPMVLVSFGQRQGRRKDTVKNLEFTRDFVINIMDESLFRPTVQTAGNYPEEVDEIKEAGFTAVSSEKVRSPRIAEAQVSMECRVCHTLSMGDELRLLVFGEVLLTHVKDELWVDGNLDPYKLKSVGRLGGGIYCRMKDIFKFSES